MKFISTMKAKISQLTLLAATFGASSAYAQETPKNAAGLAKGITSQIGDFMDLVISVGFLFGVVLFVFGLYMLYKDSTQPGQGHAKKGFIGLAVGSALLIAPTLMGVGAGSVVSGAKVENSFTTPGKTDFGGN